MTNNMNRDSNGLFTNENENETTYEVPRFKQSTMDAWEGYTAASLYGRELLDAISRDSQDVALTDVGGSAPLINAMKLQHEATMAGVREARMANMIAIATHKEYFNKGTVATAYGEINDYILGQTEALDNSHLERFIRERLAGISFSL